MFKQRRYKAGPYLTLLAALGFTFLAAWLLTSSLHVLILSVGVGFSLFLFLLCRSDAVTILESDQQLGRARETHEQLSAQLEQHRKKLNELISQMPGVVWELHGKPGEELTTTFISEYVEKMLGYPVGEWVDTPDFWLTVLPAEDRSR